MQQRPSRLGRHARNVALAAPLLTVFTLWGCPGELDDPNRFLTGVGGSSGCADIESEVFPQNCAQAFCHNATDAAAALDLVSPGLPARLINVPASTECGGDPLIDPNSPTSSVLYVKLVGAACGGVQMPISGDKFSDAQLACVEEWIISLGSGSGGSSASGMGGAGSGGAGMGGGSGGMGGN